MRSSNHHLQSTWQDFQRALYAPPNESFNAFVWLFRLLQAAGNDVAAIVGLRMDIIMPAFGLSLIVTVLLAYIAVLRRAVIQQRWCGPRPCCLWHLEADGTALAAAATTTTWSYSCCYWLLMHDAIMTYLSAMTFFYFLSSIVQSPGIVSVKIPAKKDRRFGWFQRLDSKREQERLQRLYGYGSSFKEMPLVDKKAPKTTTPSTTHDFYYYYYFPNPDTSYCKHCQHTRPPRSHHCSTCGVCILQYDHHCFWLGTCVGYGNYRSFVGLLFFLTISCAYGISILFGAFYEPLRDQIQEHGWKSLLLSSSSFGTTSSSSNGTTMVGGFRWLPAWPELLHVVSSCSGDDEQQQQQCTKIVVDVLYPLLCGVGAIMALFLGQHVKYILRGHTTLEHRVVVEQQLQWWKQRASALWSGRSSNHDNDNNNKKKNDTLAKPQTSINPFDQGWSQNVSQVVGKHWWLFFLPIPVTPPPPYLPQCPKSN